jgi:hypothetical protein
MNNDIEMQDAAGTAAHGTEWLMVIATAILCAGITAIALPWPV